MLCPVSSVVEQRVSKTLGSGFDPHTGRQEVEMSEFYVPVDKVEEGIFSTERTVTFRDLRQGGNTLKCETELVNGTE